MRRITDTADRAMQDGNPYADVRIRPDWRHLLRGAGQLARDFWRQCLPLLGGGLFCLVCDFLARTMLSPTEMNISTVTAIFGAPVVIAMLLRRQKEREVSA